MTPEGAAIFNIDNERRRRVHPHEAVLAMYPRAEEILNNPRYAIQAPEFLHTPGFSEESIRHDMVRVAKIQHAFNAPENTFNENTEKLGRLFEALVLTQSDKLGSDWLAGASVLKTSRFDDYFNKTDLIAEWPAPHHNAAPSILGLAVDVTFGKSAAQEKLLQLKKEIDTNSLGSIKYFRSQDKKIMGSRENVPRVIVGAGHTTVQQLAALWHTRNAERLRVHNFQRALIEEIRLQLRLIRDYAHRNGLSEVAKAYGEPLATIDAVAKAKTDIPLGQMADDLVYQEIQNVTRELFNQQPPPRS